MLFEVQDFCHCMDFPAGLIEKLFTHLYEYDIIVEEGYRAWCINKEDATPGKSQAMSQVRDFLQALDFNAFGTNGASGELEEEDDFHDDDV